MKAEISLYYHQLPIKNKKILHFILTMTFGFNSIKFDILENIFL